jgi:hypothetical protein
VDEAQLYGSWSRWQGLPRKGVQSISRENHEEVYQVDPDEETNAAKTVLGVLLAFPHKVQRQNTRDDPQDHGVDTDLCKKGHHGVPPNFAALREWIISC